MKVRFTPRARDDLREIVAYVEKTNPASADRVRNAISYTTALIAERPSIGIRNVKNPALSSFLVLSYSYRIHYRVEDENVWIVHIRHSARRPWEALP